MINITLDERNVFTNDYKNLTIHIHQHKDGQYKGSVRTIGSIQFSSKEQIYQFAEKIDMAIDKIEESENKFNSKEKSNKYKIWLEEYQDDINWEDFRDYYFFCERCKTYGKEQCICYAR